MEIIVAILVAEMMIGGFFALYLVFRRDTLSSRFLWLVLALILCMSFITIILSYLLFWHGDKPLSLGLLLASLLLFLVPLRSSGMVHDWRSRYRYTVSMVGTLMVYELAMGFLYGSAFLPHTSSPFLLAVNNPDFSAMMAIDAVFFFLVARKRRALPEIALFTFALSMALMPNFFVQFGKLPVLVSMLVSSLIMVVDVVLLYVLQMRRRGFDAQVLALALAACNFLEMLGLSLYAASRSLVFRSGAMMVALVAYCFLVPQRLPDRPLASCRACSFLLLVLINAAELAMSFGVTSPGFSITTSLFSGSATSYASYLSGVPLARSIDFANPWWWLFPFSPDKVSTMAYHTASSVNAFFAPFWASFMFVMMTTMSPFYAIMMGSEMSYLVLERYRRAETPAVRRWALAIIAGIPLFVVFVPLYTPLYVFGMSGMLVAVPLLLFVISVAVIVVASALFGRRVQCNLVCMAARMWTNVYYDRFKPARDHRSVWSVLTWVSFLVMLASFAAFALQETGLLGPLTIGTITIEPMIFYGMFVLNYVWWYFYFLTPVFGVYSCARQGWCGFGTLSGIFGKLFFKVRALDRTVCENCEARECEAACPVAIPLRADFLKKGYANRVTCIGCGDCVEACSRRNLRLADVREYLRGRARSAGVA